MPNYNAQNPPYSIFPGDVALAFNNEAPGTGRPASNSHCRVTLDFPRTAARFAGR